MAQLVGIDVGGTKTHIAAEASDPSDGSATQADIVVPSADWRGGLGDFAADARGLRELLARTLGSQILSANMAVGAHGCENTEQCRELERELRASFSGPLLVVNDSELIPPAMGTERAIAVVVGTGSITTARDAHGELATAGGWGWLLGDEGSAAGLVREATRAVLDSLDRGRAIDELGRRLMDSFGARNGDELALSVTETGSAEQWGSRAPEVFAAADEGSAIADAVIRRGGDHLAESVHRLLARGIAADGIVAGGSVIERQPRLQDAFRAALLRRSRGLPLTILDRPPVRGAVALARRLALGDQ